MTVKEFYDSIGVSPDEVIKRFGGSETMLTKFLNKFLADTTFNQLEEAVAAGDNETTFRAAHTLKGLAGNFDFVKHSRTLPRKRFRAHSRNFRAIEGLL